MLYVHKVPGPWVSAWRTNKTLDPWFADVVARTDQLRRWSADLGVYVIAHEIICSDTKTPPHTTHTHTIHTHTYPCICMYSDAAVAVAERDVQPDGLHHSRHANDSTQAWLGPRQRRHLHRPHHHGLGACWCMLACLQIHLPVPCVLAPAYICCRARMLTLTWPGATGGARCSAGRRGLHSRNVHRRRAMGP